MERCNASHIQNEKQVLMNKHFTEYPFNFICPKCQSNMHKSILEGCESLDVHRNWTNYVEITCQNCRNEHIFHVHWTPYLVSDDTNTLEIISEDNS